MIYLISGLGADHRIFQKLDFGNHPTTFLPWIIPVKNESLENYLIRFSEKIKREEEIILIGVSFGGMIAVELSKTLPVKKTILISSVKTVDEFSWLFEFLKWSSLYTLAPLQQVKKRFRLLTYFYFGGRTAEEKETIASMIRDTDIRILDWSIRIIFNWTNKVIPKNIYHIHGTKDRIFPIRCVQHVIPVNGGTHFMIANRAAEVSTCIQTILNKD
jgi:pimeloyl-ACP methyl ester carboxylesterase